MARRKIPDGAIPRADVERAVARAQHELNNPLACVVANLEYAIEALRAAGADGPLAEIVVALGEAREAAERIRRAVERLPELGGEA
jgi:signal transduction histidine kinase